eukprot:TRINITY_DN11859_c0_g1_i1.p1 TRINITY_DN11859_c0_g1~~TRINITY_DN11859_c0_g1_i1.p1  ORF type:complete len:546 (+),score=131.40 TRINITY_DN11859_c0_g1_i1:241-1638(+)
MTPKNTFVSLAKQVESFRRDYPGCIGFQGSFFGFHSIVLFDLDAIREVFGKGTTDGIVKKPANFSLDTERLVSESLVMTDGEVWKKQRKLLSPSFHFDHIKALIPKFVQVANALVTQWNDLVDTPVQVKDWMEKATMDAIGLAGFGHAFRSLEGGEADQVENYRIVIESINNPLRYLIKWYPKLPTESNKRTERAYQSFEKFIVDIINTKREKLRKRLEASDLLLQQQQQEEESDILDALILANIDLSKQEGGKEAQLSDTELLQNVYLFFIAGHETSASALSFTLHMLQQHPDYQSQARDEVLRVLGDNPMPSWDDIRSLNFLEACIKEALRLYPPAVVLTRVIDRDGVVCGYHMPKGALVSVPVLSIQRSQQYWEDPERYNPTRFTAGGKQLHHPLAWMPFGAGSRQCIGTNFAMLEMKIVLAFLLRRFVFEADPNCKVPFDFDFKSSMSIVQGHTLRFHPLK